MKRKHTLLLTASLWGILTILPSIGDSYIYAESSSRTLTQQSLSSDVQMYKKGTQVGKTLFPLMETNYVDHMDEIINAGSRALYNKCHDKGLMAIAKKELKESSNVVADLFKGSAAKNKPKQYTYFLLKNDGTVVTEGEYASMLLDDGKNYVTFSSKDYSQSGYYDLEQETVENGFPSGQNGTMMYNTSGMQTSHMEGDGDIKISTDIFGKHTAVDMNGNKLFDLPEGEFQPFVDGLAEYHNPIRGMNGLEQLAASIFVGSDEAGRMQDELQDAKIDSRTPPKQLSYVRDPFEDSYGTTLLEPLLKGSVQSRGYVNREGKIIVDRNTDYAYLMRRMGTLVKNKTSKQYSFITREGKVVIAPGKYEPDEKNARCIDDRAYLIAMKDVNTKKLCILSLKDGMPLTPAIYDKVTFLSQNRVLVSDKSSSLLIDVTNGKVVAEFTGKKDMKPFGLEEVTWVYGQGKYQIVNVNGEVLYTLPSGEFKYMSAFKHGFSVVGISENKLGIMDSRGKWIVQPVHSDIRLI